MEEVTQSMAGYVKVQPKKPWLAALLGIIFVGLGHFYLGEWGKGLLLLVVGIILSVLTGGILAPMFWVISCVWAYMDAKAYNRAVGYV
jgi:TM2 domain-containing membrane protein YozV